MTPPTCRQHPGGPRRDPHRLPPRHARRSAPLARLHQHHREHEWHPSAGFVATFNAGRMPSRRWAGPPPQCSKPPEAFGASRPKSKSRACAAPWQPISTGTQPVVTLNDTPSSHNLEIRPDYSDRERSDQSAHQINDLVVSQTVNGRILPLNSDDWRTVAPVEQVSTRRGKFLPADRR